ncbi:Mss4-like protein [Mycotypha africana]|uniref:Mss4-like protein n=1 Tax=Mycotypha africana TaxID=64632 RepID=UPI002301C679|nr:Mss4-like protein [Mycotypha africana]KAI8968264.1 Mss4-like protein [Mycotypha africana]
MELKGSCHCEKVQFKVVSQTPAPFMRCYCSICRKCQGGGGYAINLMGLKKTLQITGEEHLKGYKAIRDKRTGELCGNTRYFCGECGSHLYAHDPKYEDYIYPYASAIDTPLPELDPQADVYHIMIGSKADWVNVNDNNKHVFNEYPDCSLEEWHKKNDRFVKDQ